MSEAPDMQVTPPLGNAGVEPTAASNTMRELLRYARKAAAADISILVTGESGTGKEVIARYVHHHSERRQRDFVAVNCAAIPDTMLEATLFGYEKGAYTGASERRPGKFELADGGTLLLDEVTEMPVSLQAKLLRALQEREVERLGATKARKVDVRVIATSNRNLRDAVSEGHLREDLFYRLSVFPLMLPALRERRDDILPLAEALLQKHARDRRVTISQRAQSQMLNYPWPGNVRELDNAIQRALVLCEDGSIEPRDLSLDALAIESSDRLSDQMRDHEETLLLEVLKKHSGARRPTALELGISERTLRYKLKSLRDRGIAI